MPWWKLFRVGHGEPVAVLEDEAARLAGRALAYAALNLSDLPEGALLVPFVTFIKRPGDPRFAREDLVRFVANTQDEAFAAARVRIAEMQEHVNGWAFAREGLIRDADGTPMDVIVVESWAQGDEEPMSMVQPYRPAVALGGFALLGQLRIADAQIELNEAIRLIEVAEAAAHRDPSAGQLWSRWRTEAEDFVLR